jgi:hypothetical protein
MSTEPTPPLTSAELEALAKRLPAEIDEILRKYQHLKKPTQ